MKVRALVTLWTDKGTFEKGDELTVKDAEGQIWIDRGFAELSKNYSSELPAGVSLAGPEIPGLVAPIKVTNGSPEDSVIDGVGPITQQAISVPAAPSAATTTSPE